MGKQWKAAGKADKANKKGAQFSKLAKEIQMATKLGGSDPNMNARLRTAVDAAKAVSVTRETIERAIKKGSGQLEGGQIEEVMYEGFAPHKVGIMVECLTDNRNRTAPEVKVIFRKNGGALGEMNSIAWMFDRVALIEGSKTGEFDPEEEAIEAGANEVETGDSTENDKETWSFYGDPKELDNIRKALAKRGWEITTFELSYKPNTMTENLTEEQLQEVYDFLEALDDYDDTHRVYASLP